MNPSSKPEAASEQTIFDAARQIADVQARAAYLESACAGNALLCERIERLLQASQRADEFLAQNPLGALTSSLSPSDGGRDRGRGEGPGTIIGHYKLLEKLGEGGFGVVYMAEQKEPVKRKVALKIIKVGMDTHEVVARFETERQALALMDHPNIAKVFDAGATQRPLTRPADTLSPVGGEGRGEGDSGSANSELRTPNSELQAGRPYFVMELVRGVKITDYCDEKKLSTRERLDLFIKVCQAVQHAHQKGIIHRDLKPSNILVTVNDGVPVPKIIDFGIAKATQAELTGKTLFTRFHQFLGTPAYMSPEQAEMTSLDIDTRSDIYSLGVLLYELLTGCTPFDQEELLAAGLNEMRRTIREVEPVKPSTRLTEALSRFGLHRRKVGKWESEKVGSAATSGQESHSPTFPPAHFRPGSQLSAQELQRLIPALRGDLDWIVMKCLEKDRARRYETANGLATDIQRHVNNEPVVACPPSNLYKFQKLIRRNKVAFAAGVGIAAALVIGLTIALWQSIEKTHAYNRAVTAEKAAQTEAAKSRQVAQFLKDMLEGVGPAVAKGRDTELLQEILDETAKRVGEELKEQTELEIELSSIIGEAYRALGDYEPAEAMHRRALELARRLWGNEHSSVAAALLNLGLTLQDQGKPEAAEALHREALAISTRLHGEEDEAVALALNNLALTLEPQGKLDDAETLYRRVLALRRKLLGENHPYIAATLNNLGCVLERKGEFAQSETYHRDALALYQRLFTNTHPDIARSLCNLGDVLFRQTKLPEAESRQREAVAMYAKLHGDEHPDLATAKYNLALVLAAQGNWDQAETNLQEVLVMRKKLLKDDHPQIAISLDSLAGVIFRQGRYVEAEELFREALDRKRKRWGNEHREVAISCNNLAMVLLDRGMPQDAEPLALEAVCIMTQLLGQHLDVASLRDNLAMILRDQNNLADAAAMYRATLEMRKTLAGEENPAVASSLHNLAAVRELQGDVGEAELLFGRAVAMRKKLLGDEDLEVANSLESLARLLLKKGSHGEAALHAGECLAIREKRIPGDWRTFIARSLSGQCLLALAKYEEAAPLLLSGYEGMRAQADRIPASRKPRLREGLQGLVQLYEATNQIEKAAAWRQKLAEFDETKPGKDPSPIPEQ